MRLSSMVIGQFYPGDSLLHRCDPRTKIIATFLFVIDLFIVRGFPSLLLLAGALGLGIAIARIPVSWLYRGIKPVLLLVAITFLFQLFFYGGTGPELWGLGPLRIYSQGAREGGFLALRLILLVLSGSLLTFTTPPVRLTDAMGRLMAPLARIGFPAYELALMMTIALRFIPTLLIEADRIIMAQSARGAGIGRGGLITRARSFMPLLIPLFVISFRHADELAVAMEARCYRGGKGRTMRHKLAFNSVDALLAIGVAAILGTALWWGRF